MMHPRECDCDACQPGYALDGAGAARPDESQTDAGLEFAMLRFMFGRNREAECSQ